VLHCLATQNTVLHCLASQNTVLHYIFLKTRCFLVFSSQPGVSQSCYPKHYFILSSHPKHGVPLCCNPKHGETVLLLKAQFRVYNTFKQS